MKRLSIKDKRFIRHQVQKSTNICFPNSFDKKMHTLQYVFKTNDVSEVQTKDLLNPFECIFVTREQFINYLIKGEKPPQFKKYFNLLRESKLITTENSKEVAKLSAEENTTALKKHSEEKPMLRKELKKLKRDELLDIAKKKKINLENLNVRITKQVIIDQIVEHSRKAENSNE